MKNLNKTDHRVYQLVLAEKKRQEETLMMIPSENYASLAVEEAMGSCLANKYAEGYPFKRYYQGQKVVDELETLVIERVKKAFRVPHANVQALSGSPANLAVYYALLKPGEKIMGLSLAHGGHLTHGAKASATSCYYQSVSYEISKQGVLDYELIEKMALKEKPKLIISGITAYPRILDWKKFSAIAKKINAYLLADISHLAGLVLASVYPSPVPWVDVVTTTTHKTLRGPRGAIIMATAKGLKKDPEMGKKIDRAVFPALQGGPHMNNIAGIGAALKEADKPAFKKYAWQIVVNCRVLAEELKKLGFDLVTGGTDTHLILADLSNKGLSGKLGAEALELAGIVVNYNTVPFDKNPPFFPSGMRLGTPGLTSRGMKEKEMRSIARWIDEVIKATAGQKKKMRISFEQERKKQIRQELISKVAIIKSINSKVKKLCRQFPVKKEY